MASIDFNLHKIFVEGLTDQDLIEKILELKYGIAFPQNSVVLNDAVINCKGWTNLENQKLLGDKFRIENGGKNLIIFDADSSQNLGGFSRRKQELKNIADRLNVKFEIFLFPNNTEDGDLEDFYCSCFKTEMKFFETCWNNMIDCFKQNNEQHLNLNIPKSSGKVFSYMDLFKDQKQEEYKNSKGKRNYFDKGLWEFDFNNNNNLKSLIAFIENLLIVD